MHRTPIVATVLLALVACVKPAPAPPAAPTTLDALAANDIVQGFRATAVYLDDRDRPMGARMVHEHSGFTFALLQIDTAPQAYVWVNTAPSTDMGLPHTQEHLLLGKGNKGRHVAGLEEMSMVSSSAFTANSHTAYHMNTTAGTDVFFEILEAQLDAMLNPDYTDTEIEREVHHYGVVGDEGDLSIEEKGSVYNEMQSSYNKPGSRPWLARAALLYGKEHPKAKSSGGIPAAIRTVEPHHIREFHAEHYQLGNMGMIGVLPTQVGWIEALERTGSLLERLQPERTDAVFDDSMPPPAGSTEPQVLVTDYPSTDPNEAVSLSYVWPPKLTLSNDESLLMSMFLGTLAGDVSTNLYKRLINSETRVMEVEATGVWAWAEDEDGCAITIGLSGVPATDLDDELTDALRTQILDELATVAAWPADSDELANFNERMLTSVISSERSARVYLNAPPGFGSRGTGAGWFEHLRDLERNPEFRKSLSNAPELAFVREQLGREENIWKDYLQAWGMLESPPFTLYSQPSVALQAEVDEDRKTRAEAELQALKAHYEVDEDQAAIQAFSTDYDNATAELDALAKSALPKFLESPPLEGDAFLDYRHVVDEGSGVPVVTSIFPSMTGASLTVALPLDGVVDEDLIFLEALVALIDTTGVIEDGTPVPVEDVLQRTRREIRSAWISTSRNPRTKRAELVIGAQGTTPEETELALGWAGLYLYHPDWRPENLARMQDVLDQRVVGSRRRTKGAEERWVSNPKNALRWQSDPIEQRLGSHFTRAHDGVRLRWMFRGSEDPAVAAFIEGLGAAKDLNSDQLTALMGAIRGDAEPTADHKRFLRGLDQLDEDGRKLAEEATRDLEAELPTLPDSSLAGDWSYLCGRIADDLRMPPEEAIERMTAVRDGLLYARDARMWTVGAEATLQQVQPALNALLEPLDKGAAEAVERDTTPLVWSRMEQRGVDVSSKVFTGLVIPGMQGGVVQFSIDAHDYEDTDPEQLLNVLAASSYGGGGPHSLFMRTWGAGLAYSNGIRPSVSDGRLNYYAERCPTMQQTLSFVTDELKAAQPDPSHGEYAIAQNFWSRGASSYEGRGAAIASDLVDGRSPETIKAWRTALLDLRARPDLHTELHGRLEAVYGQVLPGYGPTLSDENGSLYFAIGTEEQLADYEAWLKKVEGDDAVVQRIYPRDYWVVEPLASTAQ